MTLPPPPALSAAETTRYSRHLALAELGVPGQLKLRAARVLIVGAGGLGSPAALYLAAAGVGTLGLVDFDRVDESNLQRQILFDTASVGTSKVQAARARLLALNPGIEVRALELELRAANVSAILADYDLVLDGSDRIATRYLVNDACVLLGRPLVSAAIHRFEGQAMTYVPGRGPCYRCLFPHGEEGEVPGCAQVGVLGVLPGVLGALQATEALKLLTGIGTPLVGRLLTYDALALRFDELRCTRRPDCAVCGEHPVITAPRDPPGECSGAELAQVPVLEAQALSAALAGAHGMLQVVDVREPAEFAHGHLAGAINVPLATLPAYLEEAAPAMPLVFVCRSGARSLRAGALARRAGIRSVRSLRGGLLAWREAIEPSLAL